ncbi:hypothetical protein FVF58_12280 [Paraburkholderia panacisoli]|uniref:Phage integrase family protein n=1 Tax=Paraburkholderia panacisoli TaxID=2603818 RepID=A0A5B0HBF9_9BURK|nr:hypothetical protein [Paraburkholderia panacisoli]KAA1012646.1 hypothetical protein FVF58_12280 [Paraburkholderia panacisoli]
MPVIDNARNRILAPDELARRRRPWNSLAIRTSRPSRRCCWRWRCAGQSCHSLRWGDIDGERRVLALWDAKAGGREVPLTRKAVDIVRALPRGADGDRVFPMTGEALKAAWNRALERAAIEDLVLNDLRHCAATQFAELLNGNIFLLKLVTKHKTLSQFERCKHQAKAS